MTCGIRLSPIGRAVFGQIDQDQNGLEEGSGHQAELVDAGVRPHQLLGRIDPIQARSAVVPDLLRVKPVDPSALETVGRVGDEVVPDRLVAQVVPDLDQLRRGWPDDGCLTGTPGGGKRGADRKQPHRPRGIDGPQHRERPALVRRDDGRHGLRHVAEAGADGQQVSDVVPIQELLDYISSIDGSIGYTDKNSMLQALNVAMSRKPSGSPGVAVLPGTNRFFPNRAVLGDLGGGLIALRGYYTSVRTATLRLLVNVNFVTNGADRMQTIRQTVGLTGSLSTSYLARPRPTRHGRSFTDQDYCLPTQPLPHLAHLEV